ncbi:MAG: amidohydrolase family protein [Clostridia bacterium]|nr:amidohydrolase family protein [Clostridia bacterium]
MSMLFISGGTALGLAEEGRRRADVLIRDGEIEAVAAPGELTPPEGARLLDASGCMVCPGFIDPHSHIDGDVYTGTLSLLQGITTTVCGNCGFSPLHTGAFLAEQDGFPIHQAMLIGMQTLRLAAGARDPFAPAQLGQVAEMERLCRQALLEGAAGVSLGPAYAPGASIEEMEALCRQAQAFGRPVAIDTRMNSMTDLHSLEEAIMLAEDTGCRLIVSHFVYQYGVGVEYEALSMLERARARGAELHLDSGMYKDWCSSVGSALFDPEIMRANSIELEHLRVITGEHLGAVPDEALYRHLRERHPHDAVSVNTGDQEAVYAIARHPLTMVSTDAGAYVPGQGHPQIAGSFPRFLREMVRERGEVTWEEAVRRTTRLPAEVFGFEKKGRMRPGSDADLVVFDPEAIADCADFPGLGRPNAAPLGIRAVIVGGEIAVYEGKIVHAHAGRAYSAGVSLPLSS